MRFRLLFVFIFSLVIFTAAPKFAAHAQRYNNNSYYQQQQAMRQQQAMQQQQMRQQQLMRQQQEQMRRQQEQMRRQQQAMRQRQQEMQRQMQARQRQAQAQRQQMADRQRKLQQQRQQKMSQQRAQGQRQQAVRRQQTAQQRQALRQQRQLRERQDRLRLLRQARQKEQKTDKRKRDQRTALTMETLSLQQSQLKAARISSAPKSTNQFQKYRNQLDKEVRATKKLQKQRKVTQQRIQKIRSSLAHINGKGGPSKKAGEQLWKLSSISAVKRDHIFSRKHIKNGIMDLGWSKQSILNSARNKLMHADSLGKLRNGPNQLNTKLNGHSATIRAMFKNGELISLNIFKGSAPGKPNHNVIDVQ